MADPEKKPPATSLSQSLQSLLSRAKETPMTLGDLLDELKERGHAMVIIIFSLPFLVPVPIWGLSTIVGFPLAFLGFCEMIGIQPWIPHRLRKISLGQESLIKIVQKLHDWSHKWEGFAKPRLTFMLWPGAKNLVGLGIVLTALFLSLPLPIPFTNSIPAVILIFYAVGLMERDGLCILIGHVLTLIGIAVVVVFFASILFLLSTAWHHFV